MHINTINNTSFGYNKRLNRELKTNLRTNKNQSINSLIFDMNDLCNRTEHEIIRLEKFKGGVEQNYGQINFLTEILFPLKTTLSTIADRLFPELNFSANEVKTYKDEYEKQKLKAPTDDDEDTNFSKSIAIKWRSALADSIEGGGLSLDEFFDGEEIFVASNANQVEIAAETAVTQNSKNSSSILSEFEPNEYTPKSLDDVSGHKNIIPKIRKDLVAPINNPEVAKIRKDEYGIDMPYFILLYGPPGCGKTMIAQAVAQETQCKMYMADISKLGSIYVNETAKNIGKMFDFVKEEAKNSEKPVILFMDELDSLLSKRGANHGSENESNKNVNTILTNINNIKGNNVIVIGATNMVNLLDEAGKNRTNSSYYIGMPDNDAVIDLLTKELNKNSKTRQLAQNKDDLKELTEKLSGYSPRTILNIVRNAKSIACDNDRELLKEDIESIVNIESFEKIDESNYTPKKPKVIGFV